jgi:PTS system ascorbate-specific IIA component
MESAPKNSKGRSPAEEKMIGFLLITHATLGKSLIKCAHHIMCRPVPNLAALSVHARDDPDAALLKAKALIRALDSGSGVLILTDIFGGTPSNIASRLIIPGHVEAVAGVSLPMLVRALTYSEKPLEMVVQKAITGGQDGVFYIPQGQ